MEASECGDLLRACSFYDNRKVTAQAMLAWSKAINPEVTLADALQAVIDHHTDSTDYILPAHINHTVMQVRKDRLTVAGTPPIPGDLTREQEQDWRKRWCKYVKDGQPPAAATVSASRAMGIPPELSAQDRKKELRKDGAR